MAIQIYDMGVDFTKGERTHESISDFRHKKAQANQANAAADKYRADQIETKRKNAAAEKLAAEENAAAEKRRADFRQIINDHTDKETGELNQEGAEDAIYNYMLPVDPAVASKFKKEITGERKTEREIKEKKDKKTGEDATHLARNPTSETLNYIATRMVSEGDPNGQLILDWHKANPNAGANEIRARVMEFVPDSAKQPNYVNIGGKQVNTNVLSVAPDLVMTESPNVIHNERGRQYRYETTRSDVHDKVIKEENKQAYNNLIASKGKVKDMQLFLDQLTKLSAANDKTTMGANWEEGMTGYVMSFWKGSDADKKAGLVKAIKANQGFNRLQKMRDESATGGALGQVAVKELEFLQAAIGHLDEAGQDEQAMRDQIEVIKNSYDRLMVKYQADVETGGLRPWFEVQQELIAEENPAKSGVTLHSKSSGKPRVQKPIDEDAYRIWKEQRKKR